MLFLALHEAKTRSLFRGRQLALRPFLQLGRKIGGLLESIPIDSCQNYQARKVQGDNLIWRSTLYTWRRAVRKCICKPPLA